MKTIEKYHTLLNPILYYRIIGPGFHRDLMGRCQPCNIFELMYLIGSERGSDNFEKVKLDDIYISFVPMRVLGITRPMLLTDFMNDKYPWEKLIKSLQEEGFRTPLIIEMSNGIGKWVGYIPTEGKHRFGAMTCIEPFDLEYKVPCLMVMRDISYTVKMSGQIHTNPYADGGKIKYEGR